MSQATKQVDHVENIRDGEAVNILTQDAVYSGYVSAGVCCEGGCICLHLFKLGNKTSDVRIPIRDIKEMEVIQ